MTIDAFDHYTVRAASLEAARRFYADVLGLRCEPRPGMTESAALVFLADHALIHLFQATPEQDELFTRLTPPDAETAAWATGRLQHVSFWASGLGTWRERLTRQQVPFRERTLAALDKHLIVVHDPDGLEIEIQFALAETAVSG